MVHEDSIAKVTCEVCLLQLDYLYFDVNRLLRRTLLLCVYTVYLSSAILQPYLEKVAAILPTFAICDILKHYLEKATNIKLK